MLYQTATLEKAKIKTLVVLEAQTAEILAIKAILVNLQDIMKVTLIMAMATLETQTTEEEKTSRKFFNISN